MVVGRRVIDRGEREYEQERSSKRWASHLDAPEDDLQNLEEPEEVQTVACDEKDWRYLPGEGRSDVCKEGGCGEAIRSGKVENSGTNDGPLCSLTCHSSILLNTFSSERRKSISPNP